ncbi:MAG: LysR family transcriptional regulator [Halodesulfovibrio sp.]|uniref:LysR family transcriptional regulator n=1 Tax=Halodesulfovibrio sp. TaxID=1912772 RepID=UPI00359E59C3
MNLLHLKALLLAAEKGSISSAARKLGKKQPQVSQWISDLEIDLGVVFFDRTGNKTKLSKDGEQLLPYLSHAMSQFEKFVQSAEMIAQKEPIVLTIGIENYIPDLAFALPLAAALDLPYVSVEVCRDERLQLMQALIEGDIDIIMIHESDTIHHQHFEYCRLGHYKEVLICSPDHPLATFAVVTPDDLSLYRELIWGELSQGDVGDNGEGYSPSYGVFSDIQLLITMLKNNKGFAFLPAESVNHYIESGQLLVVNCDFEPAGIDRRIELCWRNGLVLSEHGSKVIDAFRAMHELAGRSVS